MGLRSDLTSSILRIRETIAELGKGLAELESRHAELEAHLDHHLNGTKKPSVEFNKMPVRPAED